MKVLSFCETVKLPRAIVGLLIIISQNMSDLGSWFREANISDNCERFQSGHLV